MTREFLTVECSDCGESIEIIPIGGVRSGLCDSCSEARSRRSSHGVFGDRAWETLSARFRFYWNTDEAKLPCQESSLRALSWAYGAKGLNLWGGTKLGKTRTMILVLKRLHDSGKKVLLFGPSDFGQEMAKRGLAYKDWLGRVRCKDAIAFDDIGRVRMSPTVEGEFYGLLEYFVASGRPMIFTHNFDGQRLSKLYRHGDAIVARMREHFLSIHFKEPTGRAASGENHSVTTGPDDRQPLSLSATGGGAIP